jgi:uncharacterized protein (TIGR02996 family)
MLDEQALLRAIRDDPADTTARLAYADWLEEHGEPARAGFLRAGPPPGPLREAANRGQQELRRQLEHRARLRALRAGIDPVWLKAVGDPGLVGEVLHREHARPPGYNTFLVVLEETPKTALVGLLHTRGRLREPTLGGESPVLPTATELAGNRLSTWARATKQFSASGEVVALSSNRQRFVFWDGAELPFRIAALPPAPPEQP